jgi:hypothetical protein
LKTEAQNAADTLEIKNEFQRPDRNKDDVEMKEEPPKDLYKSEERAVNRNEKASLFQGKQFHKIAASPTSI